MKREIKDDLFASRVKAIRKRLKLKQVPFAGKLNISVTNLSEIVYGVASQQVVREWWVNTDLNNQ